MHILPPHYSWTSACWRCHQGGPCWLSSQATRWPAGGSHGQQLNSALSLWAGPRLLPAAQKRNSPASTPHVPAAMMTAPPSSALCSSVTRLSVLVCDPLTVYTVSFSLSRKRTIQALFGLLAERWALFWRLLYADGVILFWKEWWRYGLKLKAVCPACTLKSTDLLSK